MGMWCGRPISGPKSTAAPATVSGECCVNDHWETPGKVTLRFDPQARRPAMRQTLNLPVGCDGKRRIT